MKVNFFLIITILLFACSSDKQEQFPSLTIVNNSNTDKVITDISLVGYQFSNLNIEFGNSQTFLLDQGMSGGYSNINVNISFTCGARNWSSSKAVNFSDGDETTMNFLHCESTSGYCRGVCFDYYLVIFPNKTSFV